MATVRPQTAVPSQPVERGEKAYIQVLLGPEEGVPHFITRKFTILPGGSIPRHRHPTLEHEQYVLSGSMELGLGDEVRIVKAGEAVYIPAGTPHWYRNLGSEPVEFLCIIPRTEGYVTEWE
jgi:quercetin dioxygenase-like cupin family protein